METKRWRTDRRTDRRTDDGWTDGHSKFGGYNMIICIYQCICKILLKFVYSFLRYWTKIHFGHELRVISMLFLNEIIPLAIPYHSSLIPMSMQCICKILLKFVYSFLRYWPRMHFGHKSRAITLLFLNEIIPLAIPYHSSPIPMSMQSLKKIGKKDTIVRARKRSAKHFWHTSRAITLLFQNKISPLAIPYHSSPIPMSMQSLKKIGQKVRKLEHGNEAVTDRRTDGRTDGRRTDGRTLKIRRV